MKLLIDMNLSPSWVGRLIERDLEAVHWSTLGAHNATDVEIMSYAREHDYVVITHDLDFSAILAATQGEKPSVIQIRSEDLSFLAIGEQICAAVSQMSPELQAGALITVDPVRTRIRLLPLSRRD